MKGSWEAPGLRLVDGQGVTWNYPKLQLNWLPRDVIHRLLAHGHIQEVNIGEHLRLVLRSLFGEAAGELSAGGADYLPLRR